MIKHVVLNLIFFSVVFVSHQSLAIDGNENNYTASASEEVSPIGLRGVELKEEESGVASKVKRRFILPPFIFQQKEKTVFKTFFPFFFYSERVGEGARKDVGILPFYWAHDSKGLKTRVYFPFYWYLNSPKFRTDIVLQSFYARNEDGYHFGSAPFIFVGKNSRKQTSYQVVLPPLFLNFKNKEGGFTYSLLYYNKRTRSEFSRGVVPFYFSGKKNDKTISTVLPPLFWHINDPVNYKTTTVLPPFFFKTRQKGWSAGLMPMLYFARDENWSRNMVLPFYYGSRVNDLKSHYFPLLLSYWKNSKELKQGGIALFYHWYKFQGEYMNMVSPLFWRWGNQRTLTKSFFVPPLFYRKSSPVEKNIMAGMLFWNFHDFHLSRTFAIAPLFAVKKNLRNDGFRTWILPTFDFGKNPDGYHVRLHPLFYVGKEKRRKHIVLAPLFWRFTNEDEKNTAVFPLWWQFRNMKQKRMARVAFPLWWQFDDEKYKEYNRVIFPIFWDFKKVAENKRTTLTMPPVFWRVSDKNSARTGVLNVSLHKGQKKGNEFWTFNVFPFVLFGKPPAPTGARWEFLHGLAGWRRQGHTKELKLFWIPISIGD